MQDQLGGIEDMGPGRSKLRAVLHRWQSFETFDRIVDRRHGKLGACPGTDFFITSVTLVCTSAKYRSTMTIDQTPRADLHRTCDARTIRLFIRAPLAAGRTVFGWRRHDVGTCRGPVAAQDAEWTTKLRSTAPPAHRRPNGIMDSPPGRSATGPVTGRQADTSTPSPSTRTRQGSLDARAAQSS
jgi:hypothetical protein